MFTFSLRSPVYYVTIDKEMVFATNVPRIVHRAYDPDPIPGAASSGDLDFKVFSRLPASRPGIEPYAGAT